VKYLFVTTPLSILFSAAFMVDQNTLNLLLAIAGTVGTVVAVIGYVNKTVDRKLQNYDRLALSRQAQLLRELAAVRELIGARPMPAPAPEPQGEVA
jgi:hypothetical protein